MKAQLNIEFLAAAGLFLLTLITLLTSNQVLPSYSSEMERISIQVEAEAVSDQLMRARGRHSFGSGGSNWERNSSTVQNTEAVGLATAYHNISREKVEALKTFSSGNTTELNYTRFKNLTSARNQYNLRFVWLPTIETQKSFIKNTTTPDDPEIIEPERRKDTDGDGTEELTSYGRAENEVHYGSINLTGNKYNVLVTAHDGSYDSLYVSEGDWDFQDDLKSEEPYGIDENITENGFNVTGFQNKENNRGAVVIIRKEIKSFGPTVARKTEVVTMDRFGAMEGEPLRMEVTTW
ncbi:MAG: hypothetical protein ABEJ56_04780 [Candidatus Nanohaloarchaea archaeon]